jgi:hypothetical protein
MHTRSIRQRFAAVLGALIVLSLLVTPAAAIHTWGHYHWARTGNPFTIQVDDNVDGKWDFYLDQAITDWNTVKDWHSPLLADPPTALVTLSDAGPGSTDLKKCTPRLGRLEVCNYLYGHQGGGWLGLAQIWISGGHITQGTAKLNDTYFNTTRYNTPAWRSLVMCQEVAHTFGLDHQDETFGNVNKGSCMDYTNAPAGGGTYGASNEHPNAHDYDQLNIEYTHLDTTNTAAPSTATTAAEDEAVASNAPSAWGRVIERDDRGQPTLYEKDFGGGRKVFTFVIYADDDAAAPTDNDGTGPGTGDGGGNDGGKHDGGKKADSKQDGGKKDGGKHRQGHHDRHRHR